MEAVNFNLVYNSLSFAIAAFGASTVFFFAQRSQVAPAYKTALTLSGLVCLIAFYHYLRMFDSFNDAFTLMYGEVLATGLEFNIAYRYVGWLLTVPLLLLELVLVMRLSKEETFSVGTKLTIAAILMVILGYPGEGLVDVSQLGDRWMYWLLAMVPFLYILYSLVVGLENSITKQPKNVQGLVSNARWLLIISWTFYPIIYLVPMITPDASYINIQVGYTIADVVSIGLFGVMIYMIAQRKSDAGA
ncbi:bacteriorhodopsin-like [Methylophilaceae bacterium]|jgi:bacteriorhodopsin|nr:bacteriorhodopsin-like [Methylophilaceae bacterium]